MQDEKNEKLNSNEKEEGFGGFNTKEELMCAYNSLKEELKYGNQRITELEKDLNAQKEEQKWIHKVNELNKKYPIAGNYTKEIADFIDNKREILKYDDCLEKALLNVLATNYAQKNDKNAPKTEEKPAITIPPQLSGGDIPINPPYKPKTISEAGEIAKRIIKVIKN